MADPVPIYVHRAHDGDESLPREKRRPDRYFYDLTPTAHSPWGEGSVAFYAYPAEQKRIPHQDVATQPDGTPGYGRELRRPDPPAFVYDEDYGTIPIYSHQAGADRFVYSTAQPGASGWGAGKVAFHAYKPPEPGNRPKAGTVPIYIHRSKRPPDRYFFDDQVPSDSGWTEGTVAFYALPVGYRIGDQAADISGPDQQNHVAKLSSLLDGSSWVLIDICAEWCGPCRVMAKHLKAFVDNANSQGLVLKLFSVVADDARGTASRQQTAERWALLCGSKESVVHCAGEPTSDLRQLVPRYALANGSSSPGYPTAVLVDQTGVIRHYQLGADLDSVQSALRTYSGRDDLKGGPWVLFG